VLRRGYALVRDASGAIVRSAQTVTSGDRLAVQIGDTVVQVEVVAEPVTLPSQDAPL
jgi:exonuclease VII large subunit